MTILAITLTIILTVEMVIAMWRKLAICAQSARRLVVAFMQIIPAIILAVAICLPRASVTARERVPL
jgi:hypothetical protein